MKSNDLNYTFCLITLNVFVAVFGFAIFSDGMFFDGITYAAVANNYAHHVGTFWNMQYTATLHTSFHEHPPLAFFIQGMFFRLMGVSIYVERLYCFLMALITMFMIKSIWSVVNENFKPFFWLPVLLWMCVPLTSWVFQNNLLEMTMGVFDLCAIYFILKGCRQNSFTFLLIGGLFIFLAAFTKGLQGLFPLIAPFLYWIIYRQVTFSRLNLQLLTVAIIPVLLASVLYYYPTSHDSLKLYFEHQLVSTFRHMQDTTSTHFFLLLKILEQLLIPCLLIFIVWFFVKKKSLGIKPDQKVALFFLFTGITASIPLMISLKQRAFYLTPSIPFYILALSLMALPIFIKLLNHISSRRISQNFLNVILTTLLFTLIFLVALHSRKAKREQEMIWDMHVLQKIIPESSIVSIPSELNDHWAYHAYFMRYCRISLDDKNKQHYFLGEINKQTSPDACYRKLNLPLKKFTLYECKSF